MRTRLLALALLASCSSKPTESTKTAAPQPLPTPSTAGSSMLASDRCDAVRDLMVDTVVHQTLGGGYIGHRGQIGITDGRALPAAPMADMKQESSSGAGMATAAPADPSHYTTTNVQERGVDEGDLVKTDGKFIYTLRNNELLIAKTWPVADTELASRVAFKNVQVQQIYLQGNKVIVHGQSNDSAATRVVVIDVSDRTQPKLVRTFDVDGQNASSRVIDGDLYLVQNGALAVPPKLYQVAQEMLAKIPRADQQSLRPWEIQSRLAKSMKASLLDNLSVADIRDALPKLRAGGNTSTMKCSDLYVPQDNIQLGITSLARITIDNQRNDLVGAMVSGGQVYASTEAVYVSAPAYTWNQQGAASYQTQIHQFSLTANDGRPTYVATGAVDGQLLNQFSMSEHKGDLRVATTDWNWSGGQGGNHLFVMRAEGRSLATIGAIRGLAKGERIYAGRMFGDKGYLVTFRQTDPLFTLDLSDPKNPKVAGELKINGFSNYIHPMGGDLLLAIGQDADDNGRITGFHMQVFDVSDPSKPTRRFHEKLSSWSNYSMSAAQSDHHAFTYDPVTGTLALPVAGNTHDGEAFNALVVYNLDKKRGFELAGRITHRELAREMLNASCDEGDPWNQCNGNGRYMLPQLSQIDRSVVVDKYIMTLGASGLEIHSLDRVSERAARLRWPQANVGQEPELVVRAD
ncbi:MAG: beta-propeller domain-containing protein [Myxococcota bacterium]|nr:beta-propeller domain-containing protein [Myxococcota bacterium]